MTIPGAPQPEAEALAEPLAVRDLEMRQRRGLAEIARAVTWSEPWAAEPA